MDKVWRIRERVVGRALNGMGSMGVINETRIPEQS